MFILTKISIKVLCFLALTITPLSSPTPTRSMPNGSSLPGGFDSTIWSAIIAAITALIIALITLYQSYKNIQNERKKQKDQFVHDERLESLKEQKEENKKIKEAEILQRKFLESQQKMAEINRERVQAYKKALNEDPNISYIHMLEVNQSANLTSGYADIYIQLNDRLTSKPASLLLEAESRKDPNVLLKNQLIHRENQMVNVMLPHESLIKYKRCVFVGDPGSGKTTILKYLTLATANNHIKQLPDLPIYIDLSGIKKYEYHDLLHFVSNRWEKLYHFPETDARTYIDEQLKLGKALMLIDGLDEVTTQNHNQAVQFNYENIQKEILQLATRYPIAPIAVTMRKAAYFQGASLNGFTVFDVLDFKLDNIKDFINNWFDSYNDSYQNKIATKLFIEIDRTPRLQELAANPLLLSLMAQIYEEKFELPENRAEMYKRCTNMFLNEWISKRGANYSHSFQIAQKEQLFAEIAYEFHTRNQRYFSKKDLLQVVHNFLTKTGQLVKNEEQIIVDITKIDGLLREQAYEWYGFVHLTLQEYFVAQYIVNHSLADFLLQHIGETWWEEIILLYIGLISDKEADAFITKLIIANDIFYSNLLIAGRCLAERQTLKQNSSHSHISEQHFNLLKQSHSPAIHQLVLKNLVSIRNNSINNRLLKMLKDKVINLSLQSSIANAFGDFGEQSIANKLIGLLKDTNLDTSVRQSIAIALGKLKEDAVANDLISLLKEDQEDINLRQSIATALNKLGRNKVVVEELINLLKYRHINMSARWNIAIMLGDIGGRSIVSELMMLLKDKQVHPEIRWGVTVALGQSKEHAITRDLMLLLRDKKDNADVLQGIALALSKLGDHSIACELVTLLKDAQMNIEVKGTIVFTLGELGEHTIASDLIDLLEDTSMNTALRGSIAEALGKFRDRTVAKKLASVLTNSDLDTFILERIAEALGKSDEPSLVNDLITLLEKPDLSINVKGIIAEALGKLGEIHIIGELSAFLADIDVEENIRIEVLNSAKDFEKSPIIDKLNSLIKMKQLNAHTRWRIAETLGKLGSVSDATRELTTLLKQTQASSYIRYRVIETLEQFPTNISIVMTLLEIYASNKNDYIVYNSLKKMSNYIEAKIYTAENMQEDFIIICDDHRYVLPKQVGENT